MSLIRYSTEKVNVVNMQMIYEWNINERVCFKCTRPGIQLLSQKFCFNDLQWRLILFPNGDDESNEGYLSILLKSENAFNVRVLFSLQLDSKPDSMKSSTEYITMEPCKAWGFTRFSSNHLQLNKFSILCKMIINKESLNGNNSYKLQSSILESEGIKEVCKVDSFENLLNNQKYSDFKFIIDGKELHVHKTILTSRSKHFERMFEHETRNEDTIEDIKYEVFYELLRFLYTGKISDFDKHAQDLLIVADRYDVNELKIACEKLICKNLTIDNAINIIKFADMHNAEELKKGALIFVGDNAEEIIKLPEFKSSMKDLNEDLNHAVVCSFVNGTRCHKC